MMHLILLSTICIVHLICATFKSDKSRKYEIICIGILLFLFAALRGKYVGTDIPGYFEYYEYISRYSFSQVLHFTYRDKAWPVFIGILTQISDNPQLMLVVIGAWLAFSFSYFVYNVKGNPLIIYVFFICLRIFPFTLSGLRQTVAMGFIFIAFVSLTKKKYLQVIAYTIAGVLFHGSAIIFMVAIVLEKIKSNKLILFTSLGFSIFELISGNAIMKFLTSTIFVRFGGYVARAEGKVVSVGSTFLILICFFVFCVYYLKCGIKKYEIVSLYFKLTCLGIAFFIIGQSFDNMFRMSYYFIYMLFPMFSVIEENVFTKESRMILNIIMVTLLIIQYVALGPGASIDNYQFFWQ